MAVVTTTMMPYAVYQLARKAGLAPEAAVISTAIAWGESGLNPNAVGDLKLVDSKWGPSLGLWQVRSLHAERGTGGTRDADILLDPAANAKAMAVVSNKGKNWKPWTIWRNGDYLKYVEAVDAAVRNEGAVELWLPGAEITEPRNTSFGPFRGDHPYRLTLHRTQGSSRNWGGASNYHGHQAYPHFEVSADAIEQYVPLNRMAKALWNDPGGVETNSIPNIQVEIVGFSERSADIDDDTLGNLVTVIRFVIEQCGVQLKFPPQGLWAPGTIATPDSPLRFSYEDWNAWDGICGHVNVPENDHWDPGDLPVGRIIELLGGTTEDELAQEHIDTINWLKDMMLKATAGFADDHYQAAERLNAAAKKARDHKCDCEDGGGATVNEVIEAIRNKLS